MVESKKHREALECWQERRYDVIMWGLHSALMCRCGSGSLALGHPHPPTLAADLVLLLSLLYLLSSLLQLYQVSSQMAFSVKDFI